MTHRIVSHLGWAAAAVLATCVFFARSASADVALGEAEGWSAFVTGRIQTFGNFNDGQGHPARGTASLPDATPDANGNSVELRSGGVDKGAALPEFPSGFDPTMSPNPGHVREMRIRTGFTGNVLGFGIRRKVSETLEILGFTAVTVGIDSDERRKFSIVRPDWRESFLRVTGPWGAVTAGRTGTLFSRGATEITFLYGYRYGLGFPGGITPSGQSTAGSVGFGVLANGFGAGMNYATPILGGLQLTVGAYDAQNMVGTQLLERTRWPRPESEVTFERKFGLGMVKLFANGAWQRVYDYNGTPLSTDIYGTGFGGRVEIGPVKLGIAGHYGKGVGVTYSLEPANSLYFVERTSDAVSAGCTMLGTCPPVKMRTVDGAYAQTQISVLKNLDIRAGAGITRVHQLPEDQIENWRDDDGVPGNDADDDMPSATGGGGPGQPDSVGYVTLKHQMGFGGGLTLHAADNLHITLEYFRAIFVWYKPVPAPAGAVNPSQTLDFVNAGITYDF